MRVTNLEVVESLLYLHVVCFEEVSEGGRDEDTSAQ